jgi:diguanylate cyclase (GGDEF)-like protein/PAS domain S-box-containing protein
LRESERHFRLLVNGVTDCALCMLDPDGNVTNWNTGAERIKGYSGQEIIGRHFSIFYLADDCATGIPAASLATAAREGKYQTEAWRVRKDGSRFVASVTIEAIYSDNMELLGFAKLTRDITERKAAEGKLNYLAHYDHLTGLPNRVSLQRDLGDFLRGGPEGRPTSMALLDLDGFKDVNNSLGHNIGDQLLKQVAGRLLALAGDDEQVYRIGGDEFAVLFPECGDPLTVAHSVNEVLNELAEPFEIDGRVLYIGASAGITIGPAHGSAVDDLMENVDLALYEAKSCGGRKYRLYFPALRARAQARRELDIELRRAFADREFELYFQPQVRLADGAVVGAEALLRWRHPERGILGPGAFIEVLAESAFAGDVGRWILRTACQSAAAWRDKGLSPVRIAVNLFPIQFNHESLAGALEDALRQSGLPADALELEITENICLGQNEQILAPLQTLRDKGVQIAFDDFGTGYATLNILTQYPLSRIKIDQSFVRKISENTQDDAIIRAIIAMAHNLGLEVIAEGVETRAQAAFLHNEKCEEVQGFLYAKPLPLHEFENFLRSASADMTSDPGVAPTKTGTE